MSNYHDSEYYYYNYTITIIGQPYSQHISIMPALYGMLIYSIGMYTETCHQYLSWRHMLSHLRISAWAYSFQICHCMATRQHYFYDLFCTGGSKGTTVLQLHFQRSIYIDTSLSIKYLKHCCSFAWNIQLLVTVSWQNIALSFHIIYSQLTSCYICHSTLTSSCVFHTNWWSNTCSTVEISVALNYSIQTGSSA